MSSPSQYITPAQAKRLGGPLRRQLTWWSRRAGQALADRGVAPAMLRHRHVRHLPAPAQAQIEELHSATVHAAPLPLTGQARSDLDADPGWWGFSMRDVPDRRVDPVQILQLGKARILAGETDDAARDFSPAILDSAGRSLDLREIRYRPFHAPLARRAPDLRLKRAIWVAERVFDNYSHWLSAHLPKLVMLRDQGLLDSGDLVLPSVRPQVVDDSLRHIGVDPAACHQLARGQVLAADNLVVVACDRFHPALMAAARAAFTPELAPATGRILISRKAAKGRKLIGEAALAPVLAEHGFTPVVMEELDFAGQVALMAGASAVLAPHGAGLTNMLFCKPGTPILEIADPGYPNPNFYAMSAALGLPYGLIAANGVGNGHPLHRDLALDPASLAAALEACL